MRNPFAKQRRYSSAIDPDEIFLDAQNIPDFDTQQFEGRLEQPISKRTIAIAGIFFMFVGAVFVWRLSMLQIKNGEAYYAESMNNSLASVPLFADRGIIYDRNGTELVWNEENREGEHFARRSYIDAPGFSHLLGYVGYPSKDRSGSYWQTEFVGKDGAEKEFDEMLAGTNGVRLIETDALGGVRSENLAVQPVHGDNITLSIDARVQERLAKAIGSLADAASFAGGAGVIMDVKTGELIALANYPEYDSETLSLGEDAKAISRYFSDSRSFFLNRAVSGLYTPGSIMKPFVAFGALAEGTANAAEKILSPGYISIPNPYNPDQPTIFREARGRVHGYVDMREAIAVSSNVYFMTIGGGTSDHAGLGIDNMEKYAGMFGFGKKTGFRFGAEQLGTVPSRAWKARMFEDGTWRLGDSYNTSIGQYGFQVTPIQAVRAYAAIANKGTLLTPQILAGGDPDAPAERVPLDAELYDVIHEGMRLAVTEGTAAALNFPGFPIAAKTGTAEVGARNQFNNSWVAGFFPYDEPKYAFVILMDSAPVSSVMAATNAAYDLFSWMTAEAPEYFAGE